jgi:hypothetical protein
MQQSSKLGRNFNEVVTVRRIRAADSGHREPIFRMAPANAVLTVDHTSFPL